MTETAAVAPQSLAAGLTRLGLDPQHSSRLWRYLQLLERWNQAYNLTSVDDPTRGVALHVLDSAAVVPWLKHSRVLADIGSGAGLPGIVLAIVQPQLEVHLVEASGKKCRFLQVARRELALSNVQVHQSRAEDWQPPGLVETVTCRAVGQASKVAAWVAAWMEPGAELVLMKGRDPHSELSTPVSGFELKTVSALTVPGLDAQRHIVVLQRLADGTEEATSPPPSADC